MYRRFRTPNIWREMDQLQREMNRLMGSSFGSRPLSPLGFPAVNIWTSEDQQIVTSELPGMKADGIEINISADQLTISGERFPEEIDGDIQYHRRERSHGKFTRTIQLPYIVDPSNVKAIFKDGILEISLIRAESDKPKKIAVKTA